MFEIQVSDEDRRRHRMQAMAEENEILGDWEPTNYNDALTIDSAHVMVVSDVHYPKHDKALLNQVIDYAIEDQIDTIIWAGDYFDVEEYSTYGVDDHRSSFQKNLRAGGARMREVARNGIKQIWSSGNHENRVFRTNKSQLDMRSLALLSDLQPELDSGMLVVSDNPTVYLSRGNWMVTHPAQYGSFPGVVATKLATRYQKNAIVCHEHHWGITRDETDRFYAISSGGLFNPDLHKYINYNVTSHRAWSQGVVMVHRGIATLIHGSTFKETARQRQEAERLTIDAR
jgi:hypothetical protein